MLIETDVVGLPVLVVGRSAFTEPTVRRYRRAGAQVIPVDSPTGVTEPDDVGLDEHACLPQTAPVCRTASASGA